MEPVLIINDLAIGYGDKIVVNDFNLSVRPGEFISLLGPSGCGKTTVLRTIAGFQPALGGRILLEGRDITALPPERRDVGIVFQNYALFPTMTAYENIAFGMRVARRPKAEIDARVRQIAETSGIAAHLDKRPAEMSGGQQQRVAIARALVMGSRVLLFDEPLSNLDARVRITMRREIKRMQADFGFTAIFVTHDQDEALSMSDRIVVLNGGRIEQLADGQTLYAEPASAFICEFIGNANELPPALAERLTGHRHGRVFVRHEDVILSEPRADDPAPAEVTHVEFLGGYSRIECDMPGGRLAAVRHGGAVPQVGDRVSVSLRDSGVHVFAGDDA
ncbi:ABC transporter ATP-binding protein [Paracoccus sp. (in: a-proteobacteria)]|uniref:ABC transporter ATP-binding protein n=1 Tax=Paracoccus sp. TaxID=267 RepID=UPI0026DFA7A2|nr:ABC transporter ATP-binding protein [Paracoccus sp. (in: a-proteobacteria)]MDO5648800.1 ABC transporter ATP-binding protein [Paracoccus sp. (in: a-proteobacteria)]